MRQDINAETEFLTTKEVAKWMRVSPRTLEGLRRNGKGPPFTRLGPFQNAKVVYSRSAIIEWMERNTNANVGSEEIGIPAIWKNKWNGATARLEMFWWRNAYAFCKGLAGRMLL
jgi:predicted DNA-binding transcriptional regulator AlpA